jgi:Putative restriction endonuclease
MTTLTSESAQRLPPTHKVSFEEYIEWLDEDTRAEWVDGEIVLMSPATLDHQNAGMFLSTVLSIYVQTKNLGHIVFAPYVMKLAAISRGREPDIIFVRKDREHLLTRHYLDGPTLPLKSSRLTAGGVTAKRNSRNMKPPACSNIGCSSLTTSGPSFTSRAQTGAIAG